MRGTEVAGRKVDKNSQGPEGVAAVLLLFFLKKG